MPGCPWAADNGCYTAGERFNLGRFLSWLERRSSYRASCLFAAAPDVVGDASATWERSAPVLPQLRALGYPAALVAQDGFDTDATDWDAFDALFVGGTTGWKLSESAYAVAREARARGKWVHMGRVNSLRRLRAAQLGGYDSADGTFLAFAPDHNVIRLRRWLSALERQPTLWRAIA